MKQKGIQIRVFGPAAAGAEVMGAAFAVSPDATKQLTELFTQRLSQTKNGPVQMLVEAPDMPASVVNVFRYYGAAAVAHVLRAPPEGVDTPAIAGIVALLPGLDADADEEAIRSIENSRDKSGKALPLPPTVYETLRQDVRPIVALLFFHADAVKDVSLRLLGYCLAKAYFASLKPTAGDDPKKEKAPGDSSPRA